MRAERVKRAFAAFVMLCASLMIALSSVGSTATVSIARAYTAYDYTTIEDDLKAVDLSAYPKNAGDSHRLMDDVGFMEYGYSADMEISGDYYGIYFYVYNPGEREISTRTGANTVNMAIAYDAAGEPSEYANVGITVLDQTENRRFYKFRLTNPEALYRRTREYAAAHGGTRRYDIAGIQIWFEGDRNATDCNTERDETSYTYLCTGYAAGCGSDSEESTLKIEKKKLETVKLDIMQTTYKTPWINANGANHRNQVSSVYFSIPKKTTEIYGKLYAVTCEWDERKSTPIIVTNDQEVYDDVSAHLGLWVIGEPESVKPGDGGAGGGFGGGGGSGISYVAPTSNLSDYIEKYGDSKYRIYDGYKPAYNHVSEFADWAYNFSPTNALNIGDKTPVGWVFKSGESDISETRISVDEMKNYAEAHREADYLYSTAVDAGRTYGKQTHTYNADQPFDMISFNAGASGWDQFALGWKQFWSFGNIEYEWGGNGETVDPIKQLSEEDFSGTEEKISSRLYVDPEDVSALKTYYDQQKQDKAVFLFRFAVTDYYSGKQRIFEVSGNETKFNTTYMARETIFKSFDIISLTFNDKGNLTVLPVVASPIDIYAPVDPPLSGNFWGLVWWLGGIIVAGIIGIVITRTIKKGERK